MYIYIHTNPWVTGHLGIPPLRTWHPTSSGGVAYCVEYRGDWKWQRECCGLKSHWGASSFCHVCTASRAGNPLGRPFR